MTDNEIIKTLECLCGGGDSCTECAYHKKYRFDECRKQVAKDALYLINRLQAEIERLTKETMNMAATIETCQSEAIKEFAESLNDRIINFPSVYPVENATLAFLNGSSHRQLEILEIIDNLVKEMVGE